MTWTKLGDEFSDECANCGLSDAAYRTHVEAIAWLYRVERMDCLLPRSLVRRFVGSDHWQDGIELLVALAWWEDHGDAYEVVHHADVIRASIVAQQAKRLRDKKAQQNKRKRDEQQAKVSVEVSADVSDYADRQTNRQLWGTPQQRMRTSPSSFGSSRWSVLRLAAAPNASFTSRPKVTVATALIERRHDDSRLHRQPKQWYRANVCRLKHDISVATAERTATTARSNPGEEHHDHHQRKTRRGRDGGLNLHDLRL